MYDKKRSTVTVKKLEAFEKRSGLHLRLQNPNLSAVHINDEKMMKLTLMDYLCRHIFVVIFRREADFFV